MFKFNKISSIILVTLTISHPSFSLAAVDTKAGEDKQILSNESYAVGYEFSRSLLLLIEKTEKEHSNLEFDRSRIIDGVKDLLTNSTPEMDSSRRTAALSNLDVLTNKKDENPESIKNYNDGLIAQEKAKKVYGAMSTQSGLLYRVIKRSKGGKMTDLNSLVTLKYTGSLVNGSVFDSSDERENSSRFIVKNLHKGLREGILLMEEGDEFEFIIKPELAYKETKQPRIPPNSTLYYNVVLKDIK